MKTEIYDTLQLISDEPGKNKKQEILEKHKSPELLRFFQYVLNTDRMYNVRLTNIGLTGSSMEPVDPEEVYSMLDRLSAREITGQAAIDEVNKMFSRCTELQQDLLKMILDRSMRVGISDKTIEKVFGKGSIKTQQLPIMLAAANSDKALSKIVFPALAQTKMDGARCIAKIDEFGAVSLFTRSGKLYLRLEHLEEEIKAALSEQGGEHQFPYYMDGEIVFTSETDDTLVSRKISNGLANKSIKDTISIEEAKRARYVVWDLYTENDGLTYWDRFFNLKEYVVNCAFITSVRTEVVDAMEDAEDMFSKELANGNEGIILKNQFSPFESKRSKNLVKFKDVKDADLKCVGVTEGRGKYVGMIGSLELESSDGLVKVSVGSGLTDVDRKKDPSEYVGKIIEIKYNERMFQDNKEDSLFLPIYVEARFDKTRANSSEEIL